jgi:Mn-dependent DtxR family transcriptional regulator
LVSKAKETRAALEEIQQSAEDPLRQAAERLKNVTSLNVRDIGKLLEVSFQRVSQVLNDKTKTQD